MGGSRCYFRNCHVSTSYYPRMHFFHFPIKNKERYLQWLEMAACMHFLDMPPVFQKNRVVCARHFRDECFMNYKKDRLVNGKALPTLMRLSETTALDYAQLDEAGKPIIVTIHPPKDAHLIPPSDYQCTLYLDKIVFENQLPIEVTSVKETEAKSVNKTNENANDINKRLMRKRPGENTSGTILNKLKLPQNLTTSLVYSLQSDQLVVKNNIDFTDALDQLPENDFESQLETLQHEEFTEEQDEQSSERDEKLEKREFNEKSSQNHELNDLTIMEIDEEEVVSKKDYETVCQVLEQMLESERETHAKEKAKLKGELEAAQQAANEARKNNKAQAQNYGELQRKYAELEKKFEEQQKLANSAKEPNLMNSQGAAVAQPPAATKAQLFNGIKKYMCASMVALVRMEMFGHEERVWKPDERRVALDLLAQGEDVYRFVSDEWRCRLPAMRQVRAWQNEKTAMADDEDEEL